MTRKACVSCAHSAATALGQNGLNMPYGLDAGGRDVIVTSTFSSRLVAFDKDKGVVTESWALKPQWQYLANGSDEFIGRERRLGYIREDAAIEIDGKCYHPAYAEARRLRRCPEPDPFESRRLLHVFRRDRDDARGRPRLLAPMP